MIRAILLTMICVSGATRAASVAVGSPSTRENRAGDELVIAGQLFHTGTPVVLWTDPGGYDLAKTAPPPVTQPATNPTSNPTEIETLRGVDVPLDELRKHVDQFVIHFDACGTSKECYRVLLKRKLGVQLMCDIDGTIYQTMDLASEAYHATIANERSIGCETANVGGFEGPNISATVQKWYRRDRTGTIITIPAKDGDAGIHTPNFVGHPDRPNLISGNIQGKPQRQYDYTPQQYQALAHVAATLCVVLPKIQPDFPRQRSLLGPPAAALDELADSPRNRATALADPDQPGALIPHVLSREQYAAYQGILGHYHVQANKDDPGPAFQWLRLMNEVRNLMGPAGRDESKRWRAQPVGLPTYLRHPAELMTTLPASRPASAPSSEPTTDESGPP